MNPGGIAGGSGTQYFVGDFDGSTFTPDRLTDSTDPADYDWLDYGRDYYAAVSFNDAPDGRRLMIGWASNWDYANDTPTHPWRSAMSLVREVTLVAVRGRTAPSCAASRASRRPIGPATSSNCRCPAAPATAHALVLTGGGSRQAGDHRRRRRSEHHLRPDSERRHRVPRRLPVRGLGAASRRERRPHVDLLIVVDAMIVEIYAGGGLVTLTEQVFPTEPLTTLSVESRKH